MAKNQKQEESKKLSRRTFITAAVTAAAGVGTALFLPKLIKDASLETLVEDTPQQTQGSQIGPQLPNSDEEQISSLISAINKYYSNVPLDKHSITELMHDINNIFRVHKDEVIDPNMFFTQLSTLHLSFRGYHLTGGPEQIGETLYFNFVLGKKQGSAEIRLPILGNSASLEMAIIEKSLTPFGKMEETFITYRTIDINWLSSKLSVRFEDYNRIANGAEVKTKKDLEAYVLVRDLEKKYSSESDFKKAYLEKLMLNYTTFFANNSQLSGLLFRLPNLTQSQGKTANEVGEMICHCEAMLSNGLIFTQYLKFMETSSYKRFANPIAEKDISRLKERLDRVTKEMLVTDALDTLDRLKPDMAFSYLELIRNSR